MKNKFTNLILPGLYSLYFLFLGLIALTMTAPALSDPIGPLRFFPFVIATLGFILSICLALIHPAPFSLKKSNRVLIFLAMCFGYIVLLAAFNFLVATFKLYLWRSVYAHISWKRSFALCMLHNSSQLKDYFISLLYLYLEAYTWIFQFLLML